MRSFDRPHILMCPPDFYGIEYEINPWMSRGRQSDSALSRAQWQALYSLLVDRGAHIELIDPVEHLPDLVFTANAGLVWHDRVYLSRFRHAARQGETQHDDKWFRDFGFETVMLPEGHNFEGAGDALFLGDTLFAGYFIRSDARSMQWVAGQIGCRVIPLQLVDDRYYHLDTCFCPLSATEAIYYPAAFDEYARTALREHVPKLLPVEEAEAVRFACNAVVLGKHVVLNTGCPRLEADLQALGYSTHSTELGEYIKAGGSAKCLTLRLDGEDAALWPSRGNDTNSKPGTS
jgi:N-dimethylarginine dimethylaminohydrolase